MSDTPHDIKDDEIRIITSDGNTNTPRQHRQTKCHRWIVAVSIAVALVCAIVVCWILFPDNPDGGSDELQFVTTQTPATEEPQPTAAVSDSAIAEAAGTGYVVLTDTVINSEPLSIFRPVNLTPTLQIGSGVLDDTTARLAVQAADIRGDNGGIVGAFVDKGRLVSKGQAKSGFCAIIGDKINIGVADATPFLEQALETDGYFFRQYPLVVAGQVVENKPKGKSLRKALAELDGEAMVIMSRQEMTFHDFAQSLVDLGVSNAIYLVGGRCYGFAVVNDGQKIEFGHRPAKMRENTNFIVWR